MRQKLLIILALIFLTVLLVGLNVASYTQKEELPDSEISPNRSTYHVGATGTRAFFDFLAETGRKPLRWREPPSALLTSNKNSPSTFVVIGKTRREFNDREIEQLLRWVSQGGKLVIIDRDPPSELVKTTANWSISLATSKDTTLTDVDPSDQKQMTDKIAAAKPVQPTVFVESVNAAQPSRFASSIKIEPFADLAATAKPDENSAPTNFSAKLPTAPEKENSPGTKDSKDDQFFKIPTPTPAAPPAEQPAPPEAVIQSDAAKVETVAQTAPLVQLSNGQKNFLADAPFGSGKIVFLTDPYIVSNGGINLADNALLAANIVASRDGIIAFDEFHQGYGANENSPLAYFAGTPLTAIFLQFAALIGVFFFTQSRRFARPLPENEPNRLSKLEYVSAMGELQQRVKAYDLAIENIYTDFRRRAARLAGVDNLTTERQDLAKLLAERAAVNFDEVDNLMFKCEDIIRGEPTNKREILQITSRLRELEEKLGLRRGKRK